MTKHLTLVLVVSLALVGCGLRLLISPMTTHGAYRAPIAPATGNATSSPSAWDACKFTTRTSLSSRAASDLLQADNAGKWFALPVGGSTFKPTSSGGERIVELRGWLRWIGGCNGDPDWLYGFELDPAWADVLGIDLNQILKVGNVIGFAWPSPPGQVDGHYYFAVSTVPLIHVELTGWKGATPSFPTAPADWWRSDCGTMAVWWPFNALAPTGTVLQPDAYVRVVGSLVTDNPHYSEGGLPRKLCEDLNIACTATQLTPVRVAMETWSGGRSESDPENPARWTEMHPPDIIEPCAVDRPRAEALRVVALAAENGLFSGDTRSLDEDIYACPDSGTACVPPSSTSRILWSEQVGGETNYRTIVDGNDRRDGARVTPLGNHIHVHVSVKGEAGYGAPGKFKAVYRVRWCTPECNGRCGGDDGCGGSCSVCPAGQYCVAGLCSTCQPSCTGKCGGDDGCGHPCPSCGAGLTCQNGACVCATPCACPDGRNLGCLPASVCNQRCNQADSGGCPEGTVECECGECAAASRCARVCGDECTKGKCNADVCDRHPEWCKSGGNVP